MGGSSVLTDGDFAWRADLPAYVAHHHIALPDDFVSTARAHTYRIPQVARQKLLDISLGVSRELGFRSGP
ncbi:hypothetical protein NX794_08075 [Streptomyces sp. LP11]|uniref:Uncharacterized protein n=1 Tax=Streptomyces pyxinicus TaxID=2970331 RepID=A0ABT2AY48_9ACTN|nr:hypothetical protein [Streptomyces sp. LP11]MCS0601187.1 hypothetical protein [Streptomyces sp. LP11]